MAGNSKAMHRLSQGTPKDMIPAVKSPRRQRSSRFFGQEQVELEPYPHFSGMFIYRILRVCVCVCVLFFTFPFFVLHLSEVPPMQRHELFSLKLSQCQIMFDFNDPAKDLKGKEIKRQALQDLLEYVATTRRVITDTIYPDVIRMVNMHTHTNKKEHAYAWNVSMMTSFNSVSLRTYVVHYQYISLHLPSNEQVHSTRRRRGR